MKDSSLANLKKASLALSERYRKGDKPYLRSYEDRRAYLITRLPATEAVLARVLLEAPQMKPESYLDIGAGPGSSWYPVCQKWSSVQQAEFIEMDGDFVSLGKERLASFPIQWKQQLAQKEPFSSHDLVLFSYSWGEILSLPILHNAFHAAKQLLVIIEPGTPKGFAAILKARKALLEQQAFIVAPCPHAHKCPLTEGTSWCHFGVRLERSWEHQWMKEASLGYEDEKYSYLIVSKTPCYPCSHRLLKDPLKRKGHLQLLLCTEEGIETQVITKSEKALFKRAGKLKWGDALEPFDAQNC
ncbi:MAG: small ribosomal subunit Rsm22 family protein [Candidatus Rhabdochlamydia sp.]